MHEIPDDVIEKIESLSKGFDQKLLQKAVDRLTKLYAAKTSPIPQLESYEEHLAYLICRMPATFAVNKEIFSKLNTPVTSLLDVGAGPATAYFALQPKRATLVERDEVFIDLAKKLVGDTPNISWQKSDICTMGVFDTGFDVVCASYLLSELAFESIEQVVEKLWRQTTDTLVLIETGTPKGYQCITKARSFLIHNKASILHPCPHHEVCPMLQDSQKRWCHFRARVSRSKMHRAVKMATLGYEDEPYSYLIASRTAPRTQKPLARLVGSVCKRSGHVLVPLCTPEGRLVTETISRKQGDRYRQAKKADWGDLI